MCLFDVTPPYSTGSTTCNTAFWILVLYHPGYVIIISSSSPWDTDLGEQFIQPPAEHVLQLISNLNHKPAKHTRSMPAIWLEITQKCPACSPSTVTSHKHYNVKALGQTLRDAGSSPAWHYTFHLYEKFTLREN